MRRNNIFIMYTKLNYDIKKSFNMTCFTLIIQNTIRNQAGLHKLINFMCSLFDMLFPFARWQHRKFDTNLQVILIQVTSMISVIFICLLKQFSSYINQGRKAI